MLFKAGVGPSPSWNGIPQELPAQQRDFIQPHSILNEFCLRITVLKYICHYINFYTNLIGQPFESRN